MEEVASLPPTVRDGWIIWEVGGRPVSVRLKPDVVRRLGFSVREGFKAIPRRGLETGGLLVGTRRESANRTVVDICDFEAIESEHAAGPSYLLTEADRRLLESRIAAREKAGGSSSIVGFYRSDTRRNFAITAEDAFLFSTYFPKASDVFLLIKRNEDGPPTGGFIIREGGKVVSERPYALFPLDSSFEAPAPAVTPLSPVLDLDIPQLAPRPVAMSSPGPPRRAATNTKRGRWQFWLAVAGAIALAVAVPLGIQRRNAAAVPAARPLALRPLALNVTSNGNSLRLSWDRQPSSQAANALLWIKDGQEITSFALDPHQLDEGSVAYWPRSGDVTFRLELSRDGSKVTESVRAIGGPSGTWGISGSRDLDKRPSPMPLANPSATATAAGSARRYGIEPPAQPGVPTTAPPDRASPTTAAAGPASRSQAAPSAPLEANATSPPFRAFPAPDFGPSPAAGAPPLPDPPIVHAGGALPPAIHSLGMARPTVPADPPVRVTVEPVSGSRLEHLARNIPLIGKRYRHLDYLPPVARSNPVLIHLAYGSLARDVEIDVKVHVTPSGKVGYSEVLSKVPGDHLDLATLAMFSARKWEFVPARAGDRPVAGEVLLRYRFAATERPAKPRVLAER